MTDKPIIFSAPMVRALLDGRKFQTRRVLKPQPDAQKVAWVGDHWLWSNSDGDSGAACVPYAPGGRLWVRETFKVGNDLAPELDLPTLWLYRATAGDPTGPWRSPIHMPRRASRLTLTVTDVRVQRLQEISEADAKAEGVTPVDEPNARKWQHYSPHGVAFKALWNSLHGPDAWDRNDWVAAISFDVHRCNIDQMEAS